MSSPSGLPTNALFGFTKDLLFLRQDRRPDYLLVAFDTDGPTFRDKLYAEYKAHRAPMPDDLRLQIPLIHELLAAFRIPVLSQPGFEADDIIATVAVGAAERGLDVFICTSDKDCRQLLSERVKIYNLRKRVAFDREALLQDWGIRPEQVVDLQTLVGDSVDNVPGVPGIGIKTAAKLLQEFGTLDNILANIDKVPGAKKQEALRASAEKVLISRKLVTLDVNVQLELDWKGWRLRAWNAPRLLEHFKEWGFRSFADQVRALGPEIEAQAAEEEALDRPSVQGELFPFGENVLQESVNGQRKTDFHYHLVNTPEKFQEFLEELRTQERFAVDLETTGIDPNRSKIVGLAFSWKAGEAWYLALRGPEGEPTLDPEETLHALAEVLENPSVGKVNQNIKYDLLALRRNGVTLAGLSGDPMLADYLLHAGERSHSLADLASRYFNHRVIPISDLIGKGKSQLCIDQVPAARVAEY